MKVALVSLLLFAGLGAYAGLSEVKARMKDRLPAINSLKASGAIGEAATGYLVVRQDAGDASAVVGAENADRQAVYGAIASKTGSSVAAVAQRRAIQIAERAAEGTWLQGADGSWRQK